MDESGYTGMWQNDKTPDAPGRLENLKQLIKALENFENIQGFRISDVNWDFSPKFFTRNLSRLFRKFCVKSLLWTT